jgi:2-keto-3-deoxy-6-phosphogluconate aldolase
VTPTSTVRSLGFQSNFSRVTRTGGWLVDAEWVATDNQQELRELARTALDQLRTALTELG